MKYSLLILITVLLLGCSSQTTTRGPSGLCWGTVIEKFQIDGKFAVKLEITDKTYIKAIDPTDTRDLVLAHTSAYLEADKFFAVKLNQKLPLFFRSTNSGVRVWIPKNLVTDERYNVKKLGSTIGKN